MNRILAIAMGTTLLGCASAAENAQKEAHFEFSGGPDLQAKASFEMHCPADQLTATVMQREGMFAVAVSAGVRGCGRQASFLRSVGTSGAWILSGPVTDDVAPGTPGTAAPSETGEPPVASTSTPAE